MSNTKYKNMTFLKAMIPVIFLIIALLTTLIYYEGDPHIPILAASVVASIVAVSVGYTWKEIETGIIETISGAMTAILIIGIIGMIIGTWILSGTVPAMIYYGLKIISPKIFLIAVCLICSVVSLATGSSWTTAGTVGIAFIGMGQGLEIPLPIVAGAVVSGSYLGDKMSPLSGLTKALSQQRFFYIHRQVKRMQTCLMVKDLAVDHNLIRLGFTQHRFQTMTNFLFIANQRHA